MILWRITTITKGTPVADARKILGEGGMRTMEKEITVGRNASYTYSNLQKHGSGDDAYWTVDAVVKKKK